MLASAIEDDSDEGLKAVNLYTQALTLLDKYDHQSLEKPEGNQPISFECGVKEFFYSGIIGNKMDKQILFDTIDRIHWEH